MGALAVGTPLRGHVKASKLFVAWIVSPVTFDMPVVSRACIIRVQECSLMGHEDSRSAEIRVPNRVPGPLDLHQSSTVYQSSIAYQSSIFSGLSPFAPWSWMSYSRRLSARYVELRFCPTAPLA